MIVQLHQCVTEETVVSLKTNPSRIDAVQPETKAYLRLFMEALPLFNRVGNLFFWGGFHPSFSRFVFDPMLNEAFI